MASLQQLARLTPAERLAEALAYVAGSNAPAYQVCKMAYRKATLDTPGADAFASQMFFRFHPGTRVGLEWTAFKVYLVGRFNNLPLTPAERDTLSQQLTKAVS